MRKEHRKKATIKASLLKCRCHGFLLATSGIRGVILLVTSVMRRLPTNRVTVFRIVNNNDFIIRYELSLVRKHD